MKLIAGENKICEKGFIYAIELQSEKNLISLKYNEMRQIY